MEIVEGDVLDYQSLLSAFEDIQVVYHLAGIISILPGKEPMVQVVNVIGTRNVIQAAQSMRCPPPGLHQLHPCSPACSRWSLDR